MPQMKVRVFPGGRTELEGVGFVGASCEGPLNAMAKALGRKPEEVEREAKPEYHQIETQDMQAEGFA